MQLVTDTQFNELLDRLRSELENDFVMIHERPVENEPAPESLGYKSDLQFYGAVWSVIGDWLRETGVTDGFTFENHGEGYPSIEHYDEERVSALGQLIGDVIVELNPAAYADPEPDQPLTDMRTRYGASKSFTFIPLPTLDEWEPFDPADDPNIPSVALSAKRFRISDDLWFAIWSARNGDLLQSEPDDPDSIWWVSQMCAPCEQFTMHKTTCHHWLAFGYLFDISSLWPDIPDWNYMLKPTNDEHNAWAILVDMWQGIASRYL